MGEKGRLIIYNFLSTKTDVLDNNAGFKEENKHRIYKLANCRDAKLLCNVK